MGGLLMSRPQFVLVSSVEAVPRPLPFAEMLADHQALLQSYLDTHIPRNHTSLTIEHERLFLTGWFEAFFLPHEHHPHHQPHLHLRNTIPPHPRPARTPL